MVVKYCNAECQRNHWPKHKKLCKQRAAELRDEALFKEPPPKEDCPICFLPMPFKWMCCMSLPPATISSVPIIDYAIANKAMANMAMEHYCECCGKGICGGCLYLCQSGNIETCCPYCKAERMDKTNEEHVGEIMKRVDVNDAGAIFLLANYYEYGSGGLEQDHAKAMVLYARAADLGFTKAHFQLGSIYKNGGELKKAKFHYEAAAMAGHDAARCVLGFMDLRSGKREQALRHWVIAASTGEFGAMQSLLLEFKEGALSRESIDSTLTAYNNACAEMRCEARDFFFQMQVDYMGES